MSGSYPISPSTSGCSQRWRRGSGSTAAVRGSFGRSWGRRGRRGRLEVAPVDSIGVEEADCEAVPAVVFDLDGEVHSGGATRRPSS